MPAVAVKRPQVARRWAALAVCLAALQPQQAVAHAFGARYDLPLPLGLYIAGAGLAVCLSFVVAAVFLRPTEPGRQARRIDLTAGGLGRILLWPPLTSAIRIAAVALSCSSSRPACSALPTRCGTSRPPWSG